MRKVAYFLLIIMLSTTGCTTVYRDARCNQSEYLQSNVVTCEKYSELKCAELGGLPWPAWIFLPLIIVAAAGDGANTISSDSNYIAGGAAYKDYTQPQNQPQPLPSYQQQQINNGNGAGKYGNYPLH